MAPLYGMPPDPPRKGTPEAIILEQLEGYRILRGQAANLAPASDAENAEKNAGNIGEAKQQLLSETPKLDPNPICTPNENSKEKHAMPATVSTHAKAALRARKTSVKSRTITADAPDLERHSRKCKICNHPDREAIEELFINWHSPQSIRDEFAVRHGFDWSAIYRHARATGLYARRAKNLRAVLDHLLQNAANVPPTAHGVIAAVRAYSCLTEENEWVEPEKRVRIVNEVYRHDVTGAPSFAAGLRQAAQSEEVAKGGFSTPDTDHTSTTVPASPVEPAAVTVTGHAPGRSVASLSSTASDSGAQPMSSSYACSSLITVHRLFLIANPPELESPSTRT